MSSNLISILDLRLINEVFIFLLSIDAFEKINIYRATYIHISALKIEQILAHEGNGPPLII